MGFAQDPIRLLRGYRPTAAGRSVSSPGSLTSFQGKFFFNATNGFTGYTLWSSDGTAAGTGPVTSVMPIPQYPEWLTPYHGRIFFTAYDVLAGRRTLVDERNPDPAGGRYRPRAWRFQSAKSLRCRRHALFLGL